MARFPPKVDFYRSFAKKSIGCPIVSSMATATIGLAVDGGPVRIDANAATSTLAPAARLPMALANQKLAIQAGIKMAAGFYKKNIRLVRIRDTLHVGEFEISEAMLGEARRHPRIGVLGEPAALAFDPAGNLF